MPLKANKTLHCLLEEIPLESEAFTKWQNSTASETSESTLRCTRATPTPRFVSGKWVLKPYKARYVLSDFEEGVKDKDDFASTKMTASVRTAALSSNRPQKRRVHNIHS